jgi:hypothetical protein
MSFHYDSDLIGGSLQVRESRVIAELLLEHADRETWVQTILGENRLQKRSQATAKRVAQALRKRLERLEPEFLKAIAFGDDNLATQAAFVSALNRNLLLVEYVEGVVKDAYITQAGSLDAFSWSNFLEDCGQRDPRIYDWTESSKKKMGQVVFRILKEAGFLTSTRTLILQRVIIRPELRSMLEEYYMIRILNCLNVSQRP